MDDGKNSYIDYILSRVSSLEENLKGHSRDLEVKLDKIVNLVEKVSVLQQKEISNSDDISEIKTQLNSIIESEKKVNNRMHERIDIIINDINNYKTIQLTEISNTRAEFNKWLNRGIGAWVIGSILMLFIQSIVGFYVNYTVDKLQEIEHTVITSEKRISILETRNSLLLPKEREPK